MRVDGPLWPNRVRPWPAWASTPTLRHFSGSAHDLALALRPPRRDVAREALLALRDVIEGYAALLPIRPTGLIDPQLGLDLHWLTSSVRALRDRLDVTDGAPLARDYERIVQTIANGSDTGTVWHAQALVLRPHLDRHLDDTLSAEG
jgi:hypothetical protein